MDTGNVDPSSGNFTSIINLSGDLIINGGAITNGSATKWFQLNFTNTGVQAFTLSSGSMIYNETVIGSNSTLALNNNLPINGFNINATALTVNGALNCGTNLVTTTNNGTTSGTVTYIINGAVKTSVLAGLTGSTTTTFTNNLGTGAVTTVAVTLATGSTVEYSSAAGTQAITGRADYKNMIISGGGAKSLAAAATVANAFTLTNGVVTTTGTNLLTLAATATTSGASSSSYINGPLSRVASAVGSKTFPIGKNSNYRPLTVNLTALAGTSTMTAEQSDPGTFGGSSPGVANFASRYWTVTETGSTSRTYDMTLDGTGFTPSGTPVILKFNSPSTTAKFATTFSSPNYTATGLTSFSDFDLGDDTGVVAATPPTLTPAGGATVDAPFNVTFTDDATWRAAITTVTVNGTTLSNTAYSTGSPGQITFSPANSALLQTPGTKTIVFVATNYTNDTVSQSIAAGAANKLAFTTQPGNGTGGTALTTQPVVTVQDQYGNTATSDTSTVTVAILNNAGPGGVLSGTLTKQAGAGVADFSANGLKIDKAGTGYTLTATDGSLTSAASNAFNIAIGGAAKIAFTTQPGNGTGGSALSPQPVVTIQDAGGNTVTGNTSTVTLAIGTNPSAGTLSGTVAKAAVAGVATFTNVAVDKAGTGYTLAATDGALTGTTSTAFNVTVGAAAKLGFTTQPGGGTAGTAWSTQPVIAIQDAGGNTVTTDTSTVTVAIGTNPSSGTLSGTLTKAAVAGVADFSANGLKIDKAGTGYTLSATDGSLTSATSSAFNITAGTATQLFFSSAPTNVNVSQNFTITVQAQDAFGNLDTTSNAAVTVSKGSGSGTLSAASGLAQSLVGGTKTWSDVQIDTAGTFTIQAQASGLTTATSGTITATLAPVVIYQHGFTTLASGKPYTAAPDVFDTHLSSSSWTTTAASFTNLGGSSGNSLSSAVSGTQTYTLTFNVASGYTLSLSTFSFWTNHSGTGPTGWSMTVNGTAVGSGSTAGGANTGSLTPTNAISGVTGTVTVVMTLTGGTGGTFRLDDFTLNGNVVAVPTITATPSSLSGFTTQSGMASSSQSFTASGINLTNNILVTAPADYEVSTDNSTFTSSVSLTQSGGNVSNTLVFVRIAASAAVGVHTGNVTLASTGATTQNVALSGTASAALANEPTTQATNLIFSSVTSSSITASWTNGNGATRVVLVRATGAVNSDPLDGTPYAANAAFGTGDQIGSGNFVVFSGTGNSVTVTNLAANTTYGFAVYEFNGTSGSQNYLAPGLAASQPTTAATYTWNGLGGDWQTAANWTPARSTLLSSDILQFNDGGTYTVTNVPTQTVGQLTVSNSTAVTLQSSATSTLTISGGTGTDLTVPAGSQFNISGSSVLTVAIGAAANASIDGTMTLSGAAHRITSGAASAVTFNNGSTLTQGTGCTGNIFGATGTASGVLFDNGSTFSQLDGSNPFAVASALVVFNPTSNYIYRVGGSATPSLSGRTYGNLEMDTLSTGTASMSGGNPFTVTNLTVTSGTSNFNLTGGINLRGNISAAPGASLGFSPASANNLNLNGSSAQSISGSGTITFGANTTLVVNNASGVSLSRNISVTALTLTLGNITTGVNKVTIASGGTLAPTAGYIIGNLERTFAAASPALSFDVGTTNGFSPVLVTPTGAGSFPQTFLVTVAQTAAPYVTGANKLSRYWTISGSGITADMTFTYLSSDVTGTAANYSFFRNTGGTVTVLPPSAAPTNTSASITGVTSFANDWTLAEGNSNADLSDLSLSSGTLSPAFASATTAYTASVANAVSSITVTPTAADATSTVTVNGNPVPSGVASGSIALSVGDNVITTVVTAQNATTTKSYTVTVNRAKGDQTINFAVIPTKTYGDAAFDPGATASSGLTVSYSSSNTSVATVSGQTVTIVGAGSSTITASQGGDSNYNAAPSQQQTLTVNQKAINVTAASGQKKVKGTADPTFTYSSDPLVGGDSFSGALSRTAGESVGTYPMTQGSLTAGPNYSITFTGATFLIYGPRAAGDAATRPAGSSDIRISVASLIANDDRLDSSGATQTSSLSITSVTAGVDNSVEIVGSNVFFEATTPSASAPLTFTYTLHDSASNSDDTGTVTVTAIAATPFNLDIVQAGTPNYDLGNDQTTVSVDLQSVPNTTLHIEYSTDMTNWTLYTPDPVSTGATGSFNITIIVPGNHNAFFFQARR